MHLQKQQQRVLRQQRRILRSELQEGIAEAAEGGAEPTGLALGPGFIGLFADLGEETRGVAGLSEPDVPQPRRLLKLHELRIRGVFGGIAVGRQHALYAGGDAYRAEISEHAHALIALGDVEIPEVFDAFDRVAYAGVGKMRVQKRDPLHREFAVDIRQGQERGRKRADPALRARADYALGGDLLHGQLEGGRVRGAGKDLVEHGGIRRKSLRLKLLLLFQRKRARMQVFFFCGRLHSCLSVILLCRYYIISYPYWQMRTDPGSVHPRTNEISR